MYLKGRKEVVIYHPPKSHAHAHGSKIRDVRRAWSAIQHFLDIHTGYRLNPGATIQCHGPDKYTDAAIADHCASETTALLGLEPSESGVFRTWHIAGDQLPLVLDFAFGWDHYAKQPIDPLSLYCSFSFNWLGLPNNQLTAFESHLGIFIWGRKVTLQPTFIFDLPSVSPELKIFLSSIENDLPFKMHDDFFKSVVPKITGKGEKLIKLKKGWRNTT